jgi:hypothetical protein
VHRRRVPWYVDRHRHFRAATDYWHQPADGQVSCRRLRRGWRRVTDDGPALQTCFDAADNYFGGGAYGPTGTRGGAVHFPILSRGGSTFATYLSKQSLYIEARCLYDGLNGGASSGGRVVKIKADATGTYTNGEYAEAFLVKMGRQTNAGAASIGVGAKAAINYWGHGCRFLRLNLDCNNVAGLAGLHWWGRRRDDATSTTSRSTTRVSIPGRCRTRCSTARQPSRPRPGSPTRMCPVS